MKAAYAVVGGTSSDDFITTKESRGFPEMPALPPLVSMYGEYARYVYSPIDRN